MLRLKVSNTLIQLRISRFQIQLLMGAPFQKSNIFSGSVISLKVRKDQNPVYF